MQKSTIEALLLEAEKHLTKKRLSPALKALEGALGYVTEWQLSAECEDISSNYTRLLHFMEQGIEDPSRTALHQQFVCRTWSLLIRIRREADIQEGHSPYAITHRLLHKHHSLPDLAAATAVSANNQQLLFDYVWTSPLWSTADTSQAINFLSEEDESLLPAQCLLLSAATLAAFRYFDTEKITFLQKSASHTRKELRHRALVGAVLLCFYHAPSLHLYPTLEGQLTLMVASPTSQQELLLLQENLLLQMKSNAAPETELLETLGRLFKQQASKRQDSESSKKLDLTNPLPLDFSALAEAGEDVDSIEEKIHATAEAARRGADIMFSTFATAHGQLPFFRTPAHWFVPFYAHHPALPNEARKAAQLLLPFFSHSALCEADKYVVSLMLSQMPGNVQSAFGESQLPEMASEAHDSQLSSIGNYVIMLRRFFLLHPAAKSLTSPFEAEELLLERLPFLLPFFNPNALLSIAHTASERQLPKAALAALERLPASFVDSHICLTMGHCLRSLNRHAEAAEAYRRALLHSEESRLPEAEQALAACLRAAGRYEEALTNYRHALLDEHLSQQSRARLLHGAAECLLQSDAPAEALSLLFEAHYLCPDSRVILRALAWSAMMADRLDVARQQYAVLLELPHATPADLLNAGHAAWLSQQPAEAAALYRQACSEKADATPFEADAPLLRKKGKTEEDLRLMAEIIERFF